MRSFRLTALFSLHITKESVIKNVHRVRIMLLAEIGGRILLPSRRLCHKTAPLAITYCPGKSFDLSSSPTHAAATSRLYFACLLMSWNCLRHAICLRRCLFFCGAFTGPGFAWAAAAFSTAGALAPCGPLACTLISCNNSE